MSEFQYKFTSRNRDEALSLCEQLKCRKPILSCLHPVLGDECIPVMMEKMGTCDITPENGKGDINSFTDHMKESTVVNPDYIVIEDSEELADNHTALEPPSKIARTESTIDESISDLGSILDHTVGTPQEFSVIFSQNIMEKIDKLGEIWQSGSNTDTPAEMDIFLNSTPHEIQLICGRLQLNDMSELCLRNACENLSTLSDVISHGNCVEFLNAGLFPKIAEMTQSASRNIAGVVSLVAEKFPKPFIDSIVVSCVKTKIGIPQTELICKVTKDILNNSSRLYLLKQVRISTHIMDENIVSIFQTIVDTKVEMEENDLEEMLQFLSGQCQGLEKSTKFGKLMLALINKYGKQMEKTHIEIITQIIHCHSTFLKKSLETALKKLKPT